ncbi:MAG: flagellar M-ring protein FliF C-terminal domain-containing protein, partial [Trichlorobacter sp.]|nr:flagellar M-ring protein FliF C-terminal domain-containing protein [Trichlorobacter sp.]
GKYDTPPVTKENKEPVAKYIPRSPEELRQIEELVKGAIGFNPERGDQLSIQNIPFQEPGEGSGVTVSAQWWTNPFFLTLAKNLVIALGFVALMMMVIRPMLNMLRTTRPPKLDILENIAPETQEKMSASERAQLAMHMAEQQDLIEKAKANPYQVAQILQNWIREES